MKSLIKKFLNKSISAYYSNRNPLIKFSRKIDNYKSNIYSRKYCKLFNSSNLFFYKKVNLIRGEQYFKIGAGTVFHKEVVLTALDSYEKESFTPMVIIGQNCDFGDYLHLTCINSITIGNGVLTGRWVTISDNGHGSTDFTTLQIPPQKRKLSCKGPVVIGDNVWIGDKATILSGVNIGEGSVIAANAVVTKDVPPYSVAAGNPAKIINRNK